MRHYIAKSLPEQPGSLKEQVPNPEPMQIVQTAPARRPWYQTYHDPSNIIESRLRRRDKPSEVAVPQGESGQEEHALAAAISLHEGMEPQSIKEVYHRANKLQWEEAMKEEIQKLEKRETWKVIRKPESANIVGSKWVFRLKKDANGNVTSH